jgi:undecaprenyl diphosphate synthase
MTPTDGPLHVAIIMDGNGRWAKQRGLPRTFGHREGVKALIRTVEAAPALGIGALTVFGFSTENWRRPMAEVSELIPTSSGWSARASRSASSAAARVFGPTCWP